MNALIVPTIREQCIRKFIDEWEPHRYWDHVIVVEDNPQKTFDLNNGSITHLCWEDIDEDLGDKSWIISRRDSAIKCYGFYLAWKLGVKYIFALDDDCYPYLSRSAKEFIKSHRNALSQWSRWTESVPGWRTRGVPYKNKGVLSNVVMNHGFWNVNPDLDACQTLAGPEWKGFVGPVCKHRLIPQGQYFPMCGMNLCFQGNIVPLMYFPLMGQGTPYHRFDDIWCGIITKKICDHLGYVISCGEPFVNHMKASDPFVNLVKEAPGIAANEWFWETIDAVKLTETTPADCMEELGIALDQENDYLRKLGHAIQIWSSLFQSIE